MQHFIAVVIGILIPILIFIPALSMIIRWNRRVNALIQAAKRASDRDDVAAFERHLKEAERMMKRGPYRIHL